MNYIETCQEIDDRVYLTQYPIGINFVSLSLYPICCICCAYDQVNEEIAVIFVQLTRFSNGSLVRMIFEKESKKFQFLIEQMLRLRN